MTYRRNNVLKPKYRIVKDGGLFYVQKKVLWRWLYYKAWFNPFVAEQKADVYSQDTLDYFYERRHLIADSGMAEISFSTLDWAEKFLDCILTNAQVRKYSAKQPSPEIISCFDKQGFKI